MAFFVHKKITEVNIFFRKQQDNISHIVKLIICYDKENKITVKQFIGNINKAHKMSHLEKVTELDNFD